VLEPRQQDRGAPTKGAILGRKTVRLQSLRVTAAVGGYAEGGGLAAAGQARLPWCGRNRWGSPWSALSVLSVFGVVWTGRDVPGRGGHTVIASV
jgi:hypothetical protein